MRESHLDREAVVGKRDSTCPQAPLSEVTESHCRTKPFIYPVGRKLRRQALQSGTTVGSAAFLVAAVTPAGRVSASSPFRAESLRLCR